MLRRHILKLTAGTAIGALAVRVLAFDDKNALPDGMAAWRKAKDAGRPLLVFVVADDPNARYQNGVVLGAFLNNASDEDLAPFAMTDVVCATPSAIRQIAPKADLAADAVLVLLSQAADDAEPRLASFSIDPKQDLTDRLGFRENQTYEECKRENDDRIVARNAKLAKFVFTELGPEKAKDWAARARSHLTAQEIAVLEADVLDVGALTSERLRAGAALLLARVSGSSGKDRAQVVPALAKCVRESIVDARPNGAKWARSSGCGMSIEGEEDELRVACGMGMVPEKEQRFLFLLAKDEK